MVSAVGPLEREPEVLSREGPLHSVLIHKDGANYISTILLKLLQHCYIILRAQSFPFNEIGCGIALQLHTDYSSVETVDSATRGSSREVPARPHT